MSQNAGTGVNTVMFDFYGTVVDMQGGLVEAITPYLAQKGYTANPPSRLVTWWRRTHFENSMIDALLHRDHTPYRDIGRQAVDYTLDRAGIAHTPDEVDSLVAEIERLKPFPDVVAGLETLKDNGFRLVILSNGDPDMLERGVAFSGTAHLFDQVISVAEAGSFKPHEVTYRTATELLDVRPDQVFFVANHAFDCIGAKAAGMRTAFVDRRGRPFGNNKYVPDAVVADFAELTTVLGKS
jgi:2-haloacid dehalogenase